jgi:hypothetical protein
LTARNGFELWDRQPKIAQENLLLETLEDLSQWQTGMRTPIGIVSAVDIPSLRWALHDFQNARFVTDLPPGESTPVIITSGDQNQPDLAANYRGQDFVWTVTPAWSGSLPPDLPAWLVFRKSPEEQGRVILWARVDVFPGGAGTGGLNLQQQPAP